VTDLRVTIPRSWLTAVALVGALLGAGLGAAIRPLVSALLDAVGDAPGPLRAAASLPPAWALVTLTLAGLGVGLWVGRHWDRENGTITVTPEEIVVHRVDLHRRVPANRVAGVFADGGEFVVLDDAHREVLRIRSERALAGRLRDATTAAGLRWLGMSDPFEDDFTTWVDGDEALDEEVQALLRTRRRALDDKRLGAADEIRDELASRGIVVRDRDGGQQIRRCRVP